MVGQTRLRVPGAAGLLALLVAPGWAAMPVGVEFQVNTFTPDYQTSAEVAVASNGAFVVMWASNDQDGESYSIFGQRYGSDGSALGAELAVNSYTAGYQSFPKVAIDGEGDFVVVWHSSGQEGAGSQRGVFGQRYDSAGARQAGEFQVNTITAADQSYPAIATDADGDFVVVWSSDLQDGSEAGVFGQRFDSSGGRVGFDFQINIYTDGTQRTAAVAMESNGDFVTTWDSSQNGASDVFAQRWSSAGVRIGVELRVNTYTPSGQYGSAIASDSDGDFVVVWTSYGQNELSGAAVFGQRFDSSGFEVGTELEISTFDDGFQYIPILAFSAPQAVSMDSDGAFVVVWTSYGHYADETAGAFGQLFDSGGARVAAEFQINTHTEGPQNRPSVGMDADGDFVVVWQSYDQDGNYYGVFGQRFAGQPTGSVLDVDANGEVAALFDGLLVLRHLFGFTGTTLTTGAVAVDCNRCEADEITAYVTSILASIDIDDNGSVEALADGLLILRRLFGFSGETLTSGAVETSCNRCEADAIAIYIDGLI